MKRFIAIVALITAFMASEAEAARYHQRKRAGNLHRRATVSRGTLWSPGIVLPMITQNMGGPRMVWRGDWVPTNLAK